MDFSWIRFAEIFLCLVIMSAVIIALVTIYFTPWLVAFRRRHPNATPILFLNLFLGWTFVVWVGALAWSVCYLPDQGGARRRLFPIVKSKKSVLRLALLYVLVLVIIALTILVKMNS